MKTSKETLMSCLLGGALLMVPTSLWAQVYDIYPQPQQEQAGQGVVNFTPSVTVVCDAAIDAATKARAQQILQEAKLEVIFADAPRPGYSTLYLGVAGSDGVADRYAQSLSLKREVLQRKGKYDRHIVYLHNQGGQAEVVTSSGRIKKVEPASAPPDQKANFPLRLFTLLEVCLSSYI